MEKSKPTYNQKTEKTKSSQITNQAESRLLEEESKGNLKKYVGIFYLLERKNSSKNAKGKIIFFLIIVKLMTVTVQLHH
jgi:hypothetical protein